MIRISFLNENSVQLQLLKLFLSYRVCQVFLGVVEFCGVVIVHCLFTNLFYDVIW